MTGLSDDHRELVECCADPVAGGDVGGEFGEPHPVARLVLHPADVPAQHRVLVPEHQQLSILGPVGAEHQGQPG